MLNTYAATVAFPEGCVYIGRTGQQYGSDAAADGSDMNISSTFDAAQLFRNHPDPMWVYDIETLDFLVVNASAIAQYGYSEDEFLGMTLADIRPAEDVAALQHNVTQYTTDRGSGQLWRHRSKSGDIFYVEITAQAFTHQGRPARLVTARDARAQVGFTAAQSKAQARLRLASWELDLERDEARWPAAVYAIFGLDPRSWSNTRQDFLTLLHPDDRDRYRQALEEAIQSRSLFDLQYRARHASGAELVLHEVGEVIYVSDRPVFSAVVQDVSEFVKVREDSARIKARMSEVIEGMSDAFYLLDRDWRFSYINRRAKTVLGGDLDALIGCVFWEEFPEVSGTPFEAALRDARSSGTSRRVTEYYAPFDRTFEATAYPGAEDMAVYFRDVTEEKKDAAQRELINAAISRLNDAVFITEAEPAPGEPRNKIIYVNDAIRQLTGYGPEDFLGRTPKILHGPDTPGPELDRLHAALQKRTHAQVELVNYKRNREPYWIEANLSPIFDETRSCTHFIAIQRDITDRKKAERALHLAATRDHLTGLPNRTAFTQTLKRELDKVQKQKGTLAFLFLDLDNFKNINDLMGHGVGDEVLFAVSHRLATVVKQGGHLARFGGDEFVVIAPRADAAAAQDLAERMIEAFLKPFHLDQERISLTASIGIAVAPEDGEEAGELIRKADIALNRSKKKGRNQATRFDEAWNQEVLRTVGLTQALQHALTISDGFTLVYQPQYSIEKEPKLVGAEALLRWQHPERGAVSPAEFIPAAEQAGLITILDRQVIEMAARQIGIWNRQGRCPQVSVNLSVNTLQWEGLSDFIIEQLNAHDVPPHLFGVEIIETLLFESSRETIGNLLELRRFGISISIDDFGTGHSSFSYLQNLPVDSIKIDQSFVQGLDEAKSRNGALIQAILAMACAFELQVVAEGVETEAQRAWLERNHCALAQGFLLGRPVDPVTFASSYLKGLPGE